MAQPRFLQLKKTFLLLLITLFIAFTYTVLHEGGHALVGLASGGAITNFNVSFFDLGAHVDLTGNLNPAQTIANNLAGVCLPLLFWLIFMLAVPQKANFALEGMKVAGSLMFLSTLLAWVMIPLLYWAGQAPRGDDVVNFLNNSGVHPLWVTLAALLAFIAGWLLFAVKIDGLRREFELFSKVEENIFTAEVRKTTFYLIGIFALLGLAAFGANGFRLAAPRADPYQPPQGYRLATTIDLSRVEDLQTVTQTFTTDQPSAAGVYLLVENINSDYFEVRLTGPDSFDRLIVHAEGYTAQRDNPHIEVNLQPGEYRLLLTSKRSTGMLTIYTKGLP